MRPDKYDTLAASSPTTQEIQAVSKPWDHAPCILLQGPRPQWDYSPFLEGEHSFRMTPKEVLKGVHMA